MVASAAPSMASEPTTQPKNTRDWPATSSAAGTISASCGLSAIKHSTSPAAKGRVWRDSQQQIETAAATTINTWPSSKPKATEGKDRAKARGPRPTSRVEGRGVSQQVTRNE